MLRWHRRLVTRRWDYSECRTRPGRARAENVVRPGGRGCARRAGGRPARSPKQALSRGWCSPRQDDRPCCCDWLTSAW
ncbi:hypothetical protein EEJ42_07665 [Streptomyces botrytidirepellens]|uniref:Uncharacterized protein n=1 Tax=Streptomyces botrytidirepellens TaxID=2486417 RepID=A0A3M8WXP7_9ACTN|nr:hypothetical protein EEJ42_07665 [Streptomyces botrytidirepellens]